MSNADAFDIAPRHPARRGQRVFITRRDSGKVLEHVKELAASGRFEPVVARERGLAGGPLIYDLVKQMCACDTAIIHVTAGIAPADADQKPQLSDDVLIEIGAAMALYGREFVLLVEETIELPPCLRGLRECRYSGDGLNMPAMMRLLRAFGSVAQGPPRRLAASGAGSAFGYHQADQGAAVH
jgi:predicted nucleotide-binding protein